MIQPTDITKFVNSEKLLRDTIAAITTQAVEALIAPLPIVPETEYRFNEKNPEVARFTIGLRTRIILVA